MATTTRLQHFCGAAARGGRCAIKGRGQGRVGRRRQRVCGISPAPSQGEDVAREGAAAGAYCTAAAARLPSSSKRAYPRYCREGRKPHGWETQAGWPGTTTATRPRHVCATGAGDTARRRTACSCDTARARMQPCGPWRGRGGRRQQHYLPPGICTVATRGHACATATAATAEVEKLVTILKVITTTNDKYQQEYTITTNNKQQITNNK